VQQAGGPVQYTQRGRGGAAPAALGHDTRAGLAEMSRMAAALEEQDGNDAGYADDGYGGRGLHSCPFQLNLSSSVQHITQLHS